MDTSNCIIKITLDNKMNKIIIKNDINNNPYKNHFLKYIDSVIYFYLKKNKKQNLFYKINYYNYDKKFYNKINSLSFYLQKNIGHEDFYYLIKDDKKGKNISYNIYLFRSYDNFLKKLYIT